jgi:hypothetical protein
MARQWRCGKRVLLMSVGIACRVIASQRVGAKRRPMTGSAKQSRLSSQKTKLDCFVAALLAMTAVAATECGW